MSVRDRNLVFSENQNVAESLSQYCIDLGLGSDEFGNARVMDLGMAGDMFIEVIVGNVPIEIGGDFSASLMHCDEETGEYSELMTINCNKANADKPGELLARVSVPRFHKRYLKLRYNDTGGAIGTISGHLA